MTLAVVPVTLKEANAFIALHHRTHKAERGCRAVFGVAAGNVLVGVAVVGRPKARALQQKYPLAAEVTRCCTDGTFNAASKCYSQAWVVARSIGYRTLITYTLPSEGGACLRALRQQGWQVVADDAGEPLLFGGGSWCRPSRCRADTHPLGPKWRWQVSLDVPRHADA